MKEMAAGLNLFNYITIDIRDLKDWKEGSPDLKLATACFRCAKSSLSASKLQVCLLV